MSDDTSSSEKESSDTNSTAALQKEQQKRHSTPAANTVRFASPSTVERIRATMSPRATLVKQQEQQTGHNNNNNNHNNPLDTSTATINNNNTINQSSIAFTPVLTPNRSGSMIMLLSPSRTISQSLTSLATSTGQELEQVWDEVGYSPEDRASQISDLLQKFHDICEQKIREEHGVAATFRTTIAEHKEEISKTAAALKLDVESLLEMHSISSNGHHGQQTLTDELAAVEATLEGLRSTASAARTELQACRDVIVEAHDALGLLDEMDPTWHDVESDLTNSRRQQFCAKRAEMKTKVATRMAAMVQLVRDCQHLMQDLRIEEDANSSNSDNNDEYTDLDRRIAGSLVRSKDDSFIMSSKFRSETCVGINAVAMEEATTRIAQLSTEKRRRKTQLQEMGAEIALLWEKLRVSEEEQVAFTESVQGLGRDTLRKGEAELERLYALKSQMIATLMAEARQQITELWDQINAPIDHRRSFEPFTVESEDLFTDELLEQHEAYIGILQARLEQMKPILRLIERREQIVAERMEYEQLQKDPDRLKQRGAALTRQLMQEEKMARRIKRDLPKLTTVLLQKLEQWRKEHDEDFQYCGQVYLQVMERQEQEWSHYKEEKHQLMLIKKQEEKSLVDKKSRYGGVGIGVAIGGAPHHHHRVVGGTTGVGGGAAKNVHRQPLGDAEKKENARGRKAAATTAKPRSGVAAPIHHHPASARTMGAKQSSMRFKS